MVPGYMRCNRRQGAHRVPDEVGRLGGDVGGERADQLAVKIVLGGIGVPHKRVLSAIRTVSGNTVREVRSRTG